MINEELQKLIVQIEEHDLKGKATFGIFQYGGDADESFIKANKEGLLLFAGQLLKAAKDSDEILADKSKTIISIDFEADWIDENSSTLIHYIKPIIERQIAVKKKDYKETFVDKLLPVGCIALFAVLIVALLIGLYTLGKWMF